MNGISKKSHLRTMNSLRIMERIDTHSKLRIPSWLLITIESSKALSVMVSHTLAGYSMPLSWDVDSILPKSKELWDAEFTSPNSGNTTTLIGWHSLEEPVSTVLVAASSLVQSYSVTLISLWNVPTTGTKTSLLGAASTTTSETVNRLSTSSCDESQE